MASSLGYPNSSVIAIDPKESEMPFSDKKSCEFQERTYVHGEKACAQEECLICDDGEWREDNGLFVL